MIAGDFSAISTKIYDPATTQLSNGVVTRTQFPGNVIPSGRLNPAAVLIAQKFYPAPNLNVSATTLPNYVFDGNTITDSDQTGIRIDRNISSKDTLFGRYNRSNINAVGADVANVAGSASAERAERIGPAFFGSGFKQSLSEWMNKASFTAPAEYTFGNESRNDLIGPMYKDIDFTASKNFALTERTTFQSRGDFFNVFNHTNYSNPTVNVQSASFAQILTAAGCGREIQFGARVVF
jgi:hypothetical protein